MPKPATYLLQWLEEKQAYELTRNEHTELRFLAQNEAPWFHFLETHTSFAFQGREGRLSIFKETRPRGAGYWYAYRTSGRRTVKRYLGSAKQLTMARLEEVAGILNRDVKHSSQPIQQRREAGVQSSGLPLLLPKLLPPRLPSSLVKRPHLLERLNAALEHKLTLLVAPAGYGKTTVVNQWLHEQKAGGQSRPVAWVSLDSADNDVFRFWHSIITACQTFHPRLGQAALAALARSFQPPFTPPLQDTALTLLLNDLTQLAQDGLLVLDDYHTIEEPRIHEMLTFFLDHLPATFSVLMLTRIEPLHLPLLQLRARGDLCALHGADLRFSLEETACFVRKVFPIPLSAAVLKQLDASVQGWVAGLRLLALALDLPANRTNPAQMIPAEIEQAFVSPHLRTAPNSPYRPLLDYFVTEILKTQPEPLQRFLLQISVLTRLHGPLCEAVTGVENSAAQLAAIAESGLFLETLDGMWYRFHALFAEALRREATQRLGEETLRILSLRASHWYEQHGGLSEAIEAALSGHDFERAACLIERIDIQGKLPELSMMHHWLEDFPAEVLRAHPMLCWLAALSLQVLQEKVPSSNVVRERAGVLLRMAEEGWRKQGNVAFSGLIATFYAMSAWSSGQFLDAGEYAQQALTQLTRDKQEDSILLFRSICLFIVATKSMTEGRFAEARSDFLRAHACSLTTSDSHLTGSMLLLAGACSYALGELHQAREHYQLVLSAARKHEDREILTQALLGLATISFAWNDLSKAEQQTHEVLTCAREEDVDQINSARFQGALLAYARGEITSAQQQLAALVARVQVTTTPQAIQMRPTIMAWQSRLFLETGDLQNALRILETSDLETHMALRIVQARLWLSQEKFQEAREWLEHLLSEAVEQQQTHEALEIQVLLSLAYAACQEAQQAQQALVEALSQARNEGFIRLFLSEGTPLVRLLRQVIPMLQEPALRSFAQTLLRTFAQSAEPVSAGSANMPELLSELLSAQERRVLHLLAAGHSNQQIAQELVVSVNTVKDHAKHLYRKLGVSNRSQASAVARQMKLI